MNCMPPRAYHIYGYCQGADLAFQCASYLLNGLSEVYLKCGLTNKALRLYPRKKFIMANTMKRYGAPSVKKAFAILSAISSSKEGLGVSELARGLDMAKSTVHGMTSALEEVGAVMRDPRTKRYKLGFTLLEIGRSAYSQIDLETSAKPIMEDLMEKTQTSVFLGILNWDHVTVLDIVESRQDLKITAPVGTTMPLFAGAVGKVFLASMDAEQAAKIVKSKGLPQFTDNSIVDSELYYQELNQVRQKGYAVDDGNISWVSGRWHRR